MSRQVASRCGAPIEMLESRQLMSVAPLPVAMLSTHPTPPNIRGVYEGTLTGTSLGKAFTSGLTFSITAESKAGRFSGTANVPVLQYRILGSVNAKGKLSLHGNLPRETLKVTGAASTDGSTLTGFLKVRLKHFKVYFQGNFVVTRTD